MVPYCQASFLLAHGLSTAFFRLSLPFLVAIFQTDGGGHVSQELSPQVVLSRLHYGDNNPHLPYRGVVRMTKRAFNTGHNTRAYNLLLLLKNINLHPICMQKR